MHSPTHNLQVKFNSRQILSIALPIAVAVLVPQLNFLVNNIFLGKLNASALGNAGVTGVYFLIFSISGLGLNNALQVVLSKYAGAGKEQYFSTILSQGIRISLQYAVLCIAFTWLIAPLILKPLLGPESYNTNIRFLKIIILSLPFLFLFQMGNAFLVASLSGKYLLYGFALQAAVNILFDYLLIFGHGRFPALGFDGAAWATVLAEITGVLVVYIVLLKKGFIRKYQLFSSYARDKTITREIKNLALPLMIQYIISVTTWLIFFFLIETKGSMAKAVSNTIRNVFGLTGVFVWSFAGTCNIMVSNALGQNRTDVFRKMIWKITGWSVLCCGVVVGLINIFPVYFFSIYGQNKNFVQEAIPVLRMISVGILIMSIANTWLNAITGIGKTRINVLIEIIAIACYLVYTWYVMRINYTSLAKAWSNEIIYWSVVFLFSISYMYWHTSRKRENT